MPKDMVRRMSPGGVFLGHWTAREARDKIFHKKAKVLHATRARLTAVTDLEARVQAGIPGAALRTVQNEHLGDTRSVRVLRRVAGTREAPTFHNWDPLLTAEDLRLNRIVAAATQLARETARGLKFVDNAALNKFNRREAAQTNR